MIRVVLPPNLRNLSGAGDEVEIDASSLGGVAGSPTLGAVLDALEDRYPVLRGTIRDSVTRKRRPFLRYFACEQDLSHEPLETPLPEAVVSGGEPLLIVAAIAGG
jgi:hypothetical protein